MPLRRLFTVILLSATTSLFGQTERPGHKAIAGRFETFYNAGDYDSIFALFSDEMRKALPLDKTTAFLAELNAQAGKITKREFKKYQAGYASYKTNFERALWAVNISIDDNAKINGLFIKPFIDEDVPMMQRNVSKLVLPFKDEWTVVWGGDTRELNYHVENEAQKHAFDMIITNEKGASYKTNGETNEDYYAFGKELYAPCDGEVILVVDGVKDNKPGVMNPVYIPGNTVIIRTDKNEYLFFAHFKQHSIKVTQGQKLKQGELLGLCGNSGNSSEPHLHFHIQHVEDMNVATGVKCYFDKLLVNGKVKGNYSPVKGDRIKPG